MGHSRRFFHVRVMSAYPPVATEQQTSLDVSNVPVMDIDAAVCRGNRYPQDEDATKAPVQSLLRYMNR